MLEEDKRTALTLLDEAYKSLMSANMLIVKVNKKEQFDFTTSSKLGAEVACIVGLVEKIEKIVFQE